MKSSLRQFMKELIDYAGLFPPARLDLDPAIRNYARYRLEGDAWMLGRFIIPAGRLKELEPYGQEFFQRGPDPFRFSVLVSTGSLEAEVSEISAFLDLHGAGVAVEVVETRLPEDAVVQSADTERFLLDLDAAFGHAGLAGRVGPNGEISLNGKVSRNGKDAHNGGKGTRNGLEVFVEVPPGVDWTSADPVAVEGIARYGSGAKGKDRGSGAACTHGEDAANTSSGNGATCIRRAGYKLRCGGLESAAIPPPERITQAMTACIANKVAMKCTAGLHHPLRHFAEDVGTMQHGFLNVFGAGILARCAGLAREEVEQCMVDEEGSHFSFTEEGFTWLDRTASATEVEAARQALMTGFGSCSFDEPREDLRRLGLFT